MTNEAIRKRGYDLAGKAIHYYLNEHEGGCCGSIINSLGTREIFLQGDDFMIVQDMVEGVEKQVLWKKMGQKRAQAIIDDLLSNYFEEE